MDFEKFDTAIIPSDGIRVVSFSQRKGKPRPPRSPNPIVQLFNYFEFLKFVAANLARGINFSN